LDKSRKEGDTFIGEVCFSLDELANREEVSKWYPLESEDKKKTKGELKIKVKLPFSVRDGNKLGMTGIEDKYVLGKELGSGGFSIVVQGTRKDNNEIFAVKIIERNKSEDELIILKREIDIMKKLDHKNIIKLFEVYEDTKYIYLVLEYVSSGELFDHIINVGVYSEKNAANVVRQILEAVQFMHSHGIAHRDLKPENILITGQKQDIVKVSDFGLSKDFATDKLKTACGTPDYVAPEVLLGSYYDNTVDIWSVGVICYILLCGFPPFYGNTDQEIFNKIMRGDYDFPSPDWDNISDDAREFVCALLTLNPKERPSASQCLEAPWITNMSPSTPLGSFNTSKLTEYNEKRKKTRNNV
jgi:serine/threonine protein kinase